MKNTRINPLYTLSLALLMAMGALSGCATTAPAEVAQAEPEPEIVDDYDGDGMLLTLDGSSMETWNASLARIGRHTHPPMFKTLNSAIDYLEVYDLRAKGKKENLIKLLDGMTGYEVIEQVGWTLPEPKSSPARTGVPTPTEDV